MLLSLSDCFPSSCPTQGISRGGFLHLPIEDKSLSKSQLESSKDSLWSGFAPSMTKLGQKLTEEYSVEREEYEALCEIDNFPTGEITREKKSVRSVKVANFLCSLHLLSCDLAGVCKSEQVIS